MRAPLNSHGARFSFALRSDARQDRTAGSGLRQIPTVKNEFHKHPLGNYLVSFETSPICFFKIQLRSGITDLNCFSDCFLPTCFSCRTRPSPGSHSPLAPGSQATQQITIKAFGSFHIRYYDQDIFQFHTKTSFPGRYHHFSIISFRKI